MLTPADQDLIVRDHPATFSPVPGAWGASGSTRVLLAAARKKPLTDALEAAWRKRAPKRVIAEYDGQPRSRT
jgi:hypothetical protein